VSTPTREEFAQLRDRVNALSRDFDAAHRMALLQADIDLIRSAWARVGTIGERDQAIRAVVSEAK
jgi:hypothetical protein